MVTLIVKSGKHKGKKLSVLPKKDVLIGRDEDCQIRLATSEISRKHCILHCKAETLFVRDLGSSNGTLVNGKPTEGDTQLAAGDSLQVGPLLLQVVGKKQKNESAATDDNILDWLSEEAINKGTSSGDTAIIKISSEAPVQAEAAAPTADVEQPVRVVAKKQFKSIAEEGADIIRRHLEMLDKQT